MEYIKEPIKIFFTCLLVLIGVTAFFFGNGAISYYLTLKLTGNDNWATSVTMVWELIVMVSFSMATLCLCDEIEARK